MSGAEAIGLISGVIAIIDATIKIYSAVSDVSGLPEAFRDTSTRLPLVRETLQSALQNLEMSDPEDSLYQAIKPVLDGCEQKASRLEELFRTVIPSASASRMERYLRAVRTLGKGSLVESLMQGMLRDVQLLAHNRVMKLATDEQLGELARAEDEVSAIPPSLPPQCLRSISNYGPGIQNVNTGGGTQNNNNGSGQQFIGGTFHGPMNF
ncbi:hypothetical protein PDE_04766 [Penicillium oxalicum 114-2]|uniref:NACHT-NTPase and P-loop NTPases N-terminal domain-containing protein n=1 Tax=Penicillium oxalicum (strain 114-2 / CGMCC 5302) TaxID=933388 RepID=S7ZMC4_PENO1|nr:hypothetical protein PDE_04766 [Penicillium oxalicum 114-2]